MQDNQRKLTMKDICCSIVFISIISTVNNNVLSASPVGGESIYEVGKSFCPSVPFCMNNDTDGSDRSCCSKCSCQPSCVMSRSCCPDATPAVLPDIHTSCVDGFIQNSYYLEQRMVRGKGAPLPILNYVIVNQCSDGSACLELELDKVLDLSDLVVVSGGDYNLAYKNWKCAECNGVTDYIRWNLVVFKCTKHLTKLAMNDTEKMKFTLQQCSMVSYPPHDDLEPYLCYQEVMINTCNKTGNWDDYNIELENACLDPVSELPFTVRIEFNTISYRNVFCFLCNNPSNITLDPKWCKADGEKDIFSAFKKVLHFNFDYQVSKKTTNETRTLCRTEEVYDSYHEKCRELHCFDDLMPIHGDCVTPLYSPMNPAYLFHLVLHPVEAVTIQTVDDTYSRSASIRDETNFTQPGHFWTEMASLLNIPKCDVGTYMGFASAYYTDHKLEHVLCNMTVVKSPNCEYMDIARGLSLLQEKDKFISFRIDNTFVDFKVEFLQRGIEYDWIKGNASNIRLHKLKLLDEFVYIRAPLTCPYIDMDVNDYCSVVQNYGIVHGLTWPENDSCPLMFDAVMQRSQPNTSTYYVCLDTFKLLVMPLEQTSMSYKGILSLSMTCLSMTSLIVALVMYISINRVKNVPMIVFTTAILNLFIAQAVFQFGSGWTKINYLCETIGIALHYFWLTSVFSMNAYCIMVLKNLHTVYHPFRTDLLAAMLYIYGLPLCFILTNVVYANSGNGEHKVTSGYGSEICHINGGAMRAVLFGLPILLVVICNCIVYIVIVYRIRKVTVAIAPNRKDISYGAVYFRLLLIVGISWLFGFANELFASEVLEYLFTVFVAGQGFFLLLSLLSCRSIKNALSKTMDIFHSRLTTKSKDQT